MFLDDALYEVGPRSVKESVGGGTQVTESVRKEAQPWHDRVRKSVHRGARGMQSLPDAGWPTARVNHRQCTNKENLILEGMERGKAS